jgi:trans-aconitate 2-methyltransferase
MSGNPNWDPEQYLRFGDERLRPALDLLARVAHPGPRRVVDLGCGAGSAMAALRARFPDAGLRGVDGSASMLDKARAAGFETERADIAHWAPAEPVDVLFSNAALHWLPDHGALFRACSARSRRAACSPSRCRTCTRRRCARRRTGWRRRVRGPGAFPA